MKIPWYRGQQRKTRAQKAFYEWNEPFFLLSALRFAMRTGEKETEEKFSWDVVWQTMEWNEEL